MEFVVSRLPKGAFKKQNYDNIFNNRINLLVFNEFDVV